MEIEPVGSAIMNHLMMLSFCFGNFCLVLMKYWWIHASSGGLSRRAGHAPSPVRFHGVLKHAGRVSLDG